MTPKEKNPMSKPTLREEFEKAFKERCKKVYLGESSDNIRKLAQSTDRKVALWAARWMAEYGAKRFDNLIGGRKGADTLRQLAKELS